MSRLQYVIDELVSINDSYADSFANFSTDIITVGITNPLTEFTHLLYTPGQGTQLINSDNHLLNSDSTTNDDMETVVTQIQDFIDAKQERDFPTPTLPQLLVLKIDQLKVEANTRILDIHTEFDQINMLADVLEITCKENEARNDVDNSVPGAELYFPTAEEKAIILVAQTAKADIKTIRDKSDVIEASFDPMDFETLDAFDVTDNTHWV